MCCRILKFCEILCNVYNTYTHSVKKFASLLCTMQFFDILEMKMPLVYCDWWITFAESEVKTGCGVTTWD